VGHQCLHNKIALYRRVYLAGRRAPSSSLEAGGGPHLWYIGFWLTRYAFRVYQEHAFWTVVTSPVNGRFPAGDLVCRDPQLFVTSAILGGAEALSHVAPL
jgi:hypothetical protein